MLAGLFLFVKTVAGFSSVDEAGYRIQFNIKGLSKDSVYYLANHFADKYLLEDTAHADTRGMIIFSRKEKLKGGLYTLLYSRQPLLDFIVDQEQEFSIESELNGLLKNLKIRGSEENRAYYAYTEVTTAKQVELGNLTRRLGALKGNADSATVISSKMLLLQNELRTYKRSFVTLHPRTLLEKMYNALDDISIPDSQSDGMYLHAHYLDNYDFSDERLLRTPILVNALKIYMNNLTVQTPDSLCAAADLVVGRARAGKETFKFAVYWITSTYETMPVLGMEGVFVHMVDKYYATGQCYWSSNSETARLMHQARTLKNLLIGKFASDVNGQDSAHLPVHLYGVHARFTLLYFWNYACPHCQVITPQLRDWYHKSGKARGAEVFAVCTENNEEEWKKYIQQKQLDWNNVFEPGGIDEYRNLFNITETPKLFILDSEKKILCNRTMNVELLDSFLDSIVKQSSAAKTDKPD